MTSSSIFFSNVPPTLEIYTLSLHDALPILCVEPLFRRKHRGSAGVPLGPRVSAVGARARSDRLLHSGVPVGREDRKSTRLNSSHPSISYAVFCLKKKKTHEVTAAHHAYKEL